MASRFKEQFHIIDSTPAGDDLLDKNEALQTAMETYIGAEDAHLERVSGSRLLGAGKYSFTFALNNELAIKVSGPRTSQMAHEKKKSFWPEDLGEQFAVLSALRKHGRLARENISVPKQFFVAHSPHDNFILAQEYMKGWEPIVARTLREYGDRVDDPAAHEEVGKWTAIFRRRLQAGVEDFEHVDRLNDLGLQHEAGIHAGNVLIPVGAELGEETPLCIIDQPKIKMNI
ncbi:MAG TPA: hypothetical protein VFH06_01960 [Candidatus Saccharimonadales bacterium]|nr:hypothetical protein [Candidatus Saccharimonadales bacterium]